MLLNTFGRSIDIACDKLDATKKQELCDSAMHVMITKDDGSGGFGSFLETESETDPPVPQPANACDPYACVEMPIEGIDMVKRMYWCNRRRYKKYQSDEIGLADGFFISGSRKRADRAFMFAPSPTDDGKVIPRAKIEWVDLLSDAQKS